MGKRMMFLLSTPRADVLLGLYYGLISQMKEMNQSKVEKPTQNGRAETKASHHCFFHSAKLLNSFLLPSSPYF